MKKLLIILFFLLPLITIAQLDDDYARHNELKANVFNLIALKAADFSYEHLINSQSSVGVSIFYNLKDNKISDFEEIFDFYYREKLAITPYYRYNFLDSYSKAFFVEGFGMYNEQEYFYDVDDDIYQENENLYSDETSNNFAVGVSVGVKFMSSGGFVFEIYGGIGRNIYATNDDIATEMVRRIGASIGFRF